jgi:hypothetical protein
VARRKPIRRAGICYRYWGGGHSSDHPQLGDFCKLGAGGVDWSYRSKLVAFCMIQRRAPDRLAGVQCERLEADSRCRSVCQSARRPQSCRTVDCLRCDRKPLYVRSTCARHRKHNRREIAAAAESEIVAAAIVLASQPRRSLGTCAKSRRVPVELFLFTSNVLVSNSIGPSLIPSIVISRSNTHTHTYSGR